MADEPKELQGIDWRRCFAFLEITRSFRLAVHPASMLLCFVGLALTVGLGVLVDQIPYVGQTQVYGRSVYENLVPMVQKLWGDWSLPWREGKKWEDFVWFAAAPVRTMLDAADLAVKYWQRATPFAVVMTVLKLAIWAVIGGAVTRLAAVRIARDEGVPLKKALGFSIRKWPSLVTSPLVPFGVLALVALVAGLPTGLVLQIPYAGEFIIGVFFFLTLLVGLVMALIIVGGTFSVGLQWPTIAAEGSDSFDAISRSISYISSRPWKYLFYTAFSAVYGCLTFIFVKFVAFLTLWITHQAVSTFSFGGEALVPDKISRLWTEPALSHPWDQYYDRFYGAEAAASNLFLFWVWVVIGMALAYLVSFMLTSQTVIYFLLRRAVDATDIEEVYMEESEEEQLPLGQKAAAPEIVKAESPAQPSPPPAESQ